MGQPSERTDGDATSRVTSIRIAGSSGRVRVISEVRSDVDVSRGGTVTVVGACATVEVGSDNVEVRVPEHVDAVIGTTSGQVDVKGPLGSLAVVTESGRIRVEAADSADLRTASGRIELGDVAHRSRVRSASAKVTIGSTGEADVATTSGRIYLRSVSGEVRAHCVSGKIAIGLEGAADVEAETVSGRISLTLPAGVTFQQVTGSLGSTPSTHGSDCTVATRSVSGRISVEHR